MEVDVTMEEEEKPIIINNDSMSELEDGELEEDSDEEPVRDRRIVYGNSSSEKERLSKRAERFGIITSRKLPEDPEIRKLHISMGVNNNTRTEALHLYGTDSMKTQDVFQYFDDPPASVEWITNQSCNAVWLDEVSCAKALLKHTIKIRGQPDNIDSDSEGEEYVCADELRLTLPPGGVWRKGQTKSFAPNLLIRYANVNDKKEFRPYVPESLKMKEKLFPDGGDESVKKLVSQEESNPWSGLARQWGTFERHSKNKFGVPDARELIKEKELRESLIKKDARDLIKYNRICKLEKGLDPETLSDFRQDFQKSLGRSHKRSLDSEVFSSLRKKRKHSPHRELQIIVENDSYRPSKKPTRARSISSSSESSSSSSDSSSSSSDSSSSSSSSEDEEEAPPPPPPPPASKAPSLKTPWNKVSNKFKPESSLLIEIDNDHYRKKRSTD